MAKIDSGSKSSRLLASRRYTHDTFTTAQESFTNVLDLRSEEIYTQAGSIPSSGLPFSGSSQSGSYYQVGGENILRYWYRHRLTKSSTNNETWFFLSPPDANVGAQLISDDQLTNFISPKYSVSALANANAEDGTPGYGAKLIVSTATESGSIDIGNNASLVSGNNFVFDYKTGIVQFMNSSVDPSDSEYVYMTAYQYVGKTLATGLELTGNVSSSATSTGSFGDLQIGAVGSQLFSKFSSSIQSRVGASEAGNITEVTAGTGLSGGGSSGDVTLNVDFGDADLQTAVSGAFTATSQSISTRLTAESTNIDNLQTDSGSFSTRITTESTNIDNLESKVGQSLNTSNSPTFAGLTISGNISASGDITAQNYIVRSTVTTITSSFSSGSTIFGDTINDTHLFTGSISVSGSITQNSKATASFGELVVGGTGNSQNYSDFSSSIQTRIASAVAGGVTGVTGGTGISSTGGNTPTVAVDFTDATFKTAISGSAEVTLANAADLSNKRLIGPKIINSNAELQTNQIYFGNVALDQYTTLLSGNTSTVKQITLPTATGTISLIGNTETLTNKTLHQDLVSGHLTFTNTAVMRMRHSDFSNDAFYTEITKTDPTQNRTITLPNATGTVSLIGNTETLTNKTLTNPVINGTSITGTGIKDEDDMSSDSDVHLATQQSIKAYVDSSVTGQDLDFQGDSGGALSIDLDSESLTIAGGTGLSSVGGTNTVTLNIDFTDSTLKSAISGSLGTNATLIRTLNATGISGSFTQPSSSFSTRVTNLKTDSGSFSARTQTLETTMTSEQTNIDNLQSDSGSFSTRVTNLKTDSGSFSTRTTNLKTDSGSISTRLQSVEQNAGGQSLGSTSKPTFAGLTISGNISASGDITAQNYIVRSTVTTITSSFSSGSTIFGDDILDTHRFTGSVITSGSITATSFVGNGSGLTNVFEGTTASSSISTRLTTESTNIDNLQTASGSFSTRVTDVKTRITTEEANVDALQARSISTGLGLSGGGDLTGDRTLTINFGDETFAAGISGSFTQPSSSISTRLKTLEADPGGIFVATGSVFGTTNNLQVTGSIKATSFVGDGSGLTGLVTADSVQFSAFDSDSNGDLMPTAENSFAKVLYELDGNNDLMPI